MTFLDAASKPNSEHRRTVPVRDVVVMLAEDLVDDNPHRSRQIRGPYRNDALQQYRKGDAQNYVFWYASISGRSYPLNSPEEIDWNS